jgi:hypothetical protein
VIGGVCGSAGFGVGGVIGSFGMDVKCRPGEYVPRSRMAATRSAGYSRGGLHARTFEVIINIRTAKAWVSTCRLDHALVPRRLSNSLGVGANRNGAPVAWWYFQGGKLQIRCYAPGGGV